MLNIQELFAAYAQAQKTVEDFRAELPPEIVQAEKDIETLKKALQDHAKANGECYGSGWEVALSERGSWEGKLLDGYAKAHPEIQSFKKTTLVATVRRMK